VLNAPANIAATRPVEFNASVLQQIRKHARSSMTAEVCGILIGAEVDGVTRIEACIAGENAAQGGAHVTFTQNTWEHIYKIKDSKFPDRVIVGWYHSHPGFGIFLSEYDIFIHEHFFGAPFQVAWVFDPHSDDEGCFGWVEKNVKPLGRISVLRNESIAGKKFAEPARQIADAASSTSQSIPSRGFNLFTGNVIVAIVCLLIFIVGLLLGPIVERRLFVRERAPTSFPSNETLFPTFKTNAGTSLGPSPLVQKSDARQKPVSQKNTTP
jgi:proteasome lid subunit RPN8/RPN11